MNETFLLHASSSPPESWALPVADAILPVVFMTVVVAVLLMSSNPNHESTK